MSQTVTGSAGALTLAGTPTTTAPVDLEAATAASQVTLVQAPLNWIDLVRAKVRALFDGTQTVKSLHIDGTGQQASAAGSGNLAVFGNATIGGDVGAAGDVAAAGTIKGKRIKVGGTAITSGDFALGTGWGNTATLTVNPGSTDTAGSLYVTCGGTGIAANPRIIMTFKDGTFPANGCVQLVQLYDNDESANAGPLYHVLIKPSLTAPQWFMLGTPITGKNYFFQWITLSR